jgi:hypothetical protein
MASLNTAAACHGDHIRKKPRVIAVFLFSAFGTRYNSISLTRFAKRSASLVCTLIKSMGNISSAIERL